MEGRDGRTLRLPVPCLLSLAEKCSLGAFQLVAFGQVFRARNVTVGHLSPGQKKTRTSGPHSLVSSRGRCGTASAGFKGTDPVGL